jgi:glycosyltransferase involved in cell wall biosynthesis
VFDAMHASDTTAEEIQLNAAFQVYLNGPESRGFVEQYLKYCLDLDLINDAGKDTDIMDTRHDQSILSIMSSEHPFVTVSRDVTQWGKLDPPASVRQPAGGIVELDELDDRGIMHNLVEHHRRLMNIPKIAVITATVGGPFLDACIRSVQESTLPNIEHWIVVDGREYDSKVDGIIRKYERRHPIVKIVLPNNVGAGGWCGHKIYGSLPWIADAEYVSFLDDDNVVAPTHFAGLLRSIVQSPGTLWSYSLRHLIDRDGRAVGFDNCESLGGISHTVDGPGHYLIDTSCYMMHRELAITTSPVWNARFRDPSGRPNPDRELAKTLLASAPHAVVRAHTLGYRVGSTNLSVTLGYFQRGNKAFGYDFSAFEDIYIFHFSRKATEDFLSARQAFSTRSFALDEWQMTLLKGLDGLRGGKFNLINGFANYPNIPKNAVVLVTLCQPAEIPLDFLKQRQDLCRIVYTLESPNVRHAGQWNARWLSEHFDVALTYFEPFLDAPPPGLRVVFAPHNCHHGDMNDPLDRACLLRDNRGTGRSVGLVLERRPELFGQGEYSVNGVRLKCLDSVREDLVRGQTDVTVFGTNWGSVADGTHVKLGHDRHRNLDAQSAVDHKQRFVFDLIVENCDAPGYVSEKFYDALSAGCIPLYYGNMFARLGDLIPEGAAYFDLKKRNIHTGEDVQTLIDSLDDDVISEMRQNVVMCRERVLAFAGTASFADAVEQGIRTASDSKQSVELV